MKKVLDFARRFDMLPRYELLLVAVSGGMDSMCLLDFLYENGYRVLAAHYNHQLRGQESDMDEDLVRSWCAARRIAFCVGSGDVARYAHEHRLTVEEAARKLRYEFLNTIAEQTGAVRILTAHHADDNAETVLFHLARGTGMTGLTGISPVNGKLVRPFLCLTRQEIAAYAREHRVPYRTDASNADTSLTRNFIRAEIMPRMAHVSPHAAEHIADTALRLRQEDAFLDSLAEKRLAALCEKSGSVSLPCSAIADAPEVLRPRMLRIALDRLGAGKKDFSAAHYEFLSALCAGTGAAQLDLPGGVTARRSDGVLTLRTAAQSALPRVPLRENETVCWGDYAISCRKGKKGIENSENIIILKGAAPLSVGPWDARESITLPDARGARSLKRLFAERGIEPDARGRVPVIRSGDVLAAVCGIGTDAAFVPDPDDDDTWILQVQKQHK